MCKGLGGENKSVLPFLCLGAEACSVAVSALRSVDAAPEQWDLPNPQGHGPSSCKPQGISPSLVTQMICTSTVVHHTHLVFSFY